MSPSSISSRERLRTLSLLPFTDNNPPARLEFDGKRGKPLLVRQLAKAHRAETGELQLCRKPPPPRHRPEPLREDRLLTVGQRRQRPMACHLPKDAKIARDAKVLMQEMVRSSSAS